MNTDVIVIGAGPAGCMAALTAANGGKSVLLLDGNEKIGRKLMITGKGRCNLTNDCTPENVIKNTLRNPRFLYSCLHRFSPDDVKNFFQSAGVALKTERGNRVFPVSDRSADIVDALYRSLKGRVTLSLGERVMKVGKQDGVFFAETEKSTRQAKSLILCTGGKSYSATGSKGDGYAFAEAFGHTVIPPRPSLVPILCSDADIGALEGLSLRNVTLRLIKNGEKKPVFTELGELLFTSRGISGPLALSASCHLTDEPSLYRLEIDLKPGLNEETLDARILRDFSSNKNKFFSHSLSDLLPSSLIPIVVARSGILPETRVHSVTKSQRDALLRVVKEFALTPFSLGSMEEAVITRGGVDVKQIDPVTMQSKLTEGLFFAGEVLDCDAYTGGYNLQIAFSTGYAAGKGAGERE